MPVGWVQEGCFACRASGCAMGLEGDVYACTQCKGAGAVARHLRSGLVALYPGGPILWRQRGEA